MIAVLGRKDLGTGILRNLTHGGEGVSGRVVSEKTKAKFTKNSKARKAAKLKTQKTVELTRISDGIVFVYECMSDAARALNLNFGNLGQVCLGKRKSTKGFTARYLEDNVGVKIKEQMAPNEA